MKAKKIVNRMLDDPTTAAAALAGVTPLYHYYDVHVSYGGDEGYSAFIETTIAPPKGTRFSDKIQDDYLQMQIAAEAVRQGRVERDDTSEIDYIALVDAEEWSEFNTMLREAEEPDPEHYINKLPAVFKPGETIEAIQNECAYCMDDPEDKAAFIEWIKQHENLFPDVAKALAVIERNDSWCTDELADMAAFFEALGYSFDNTHCPRCDGSGEEPGAPVDDEGGRWLCQWCGGEGKLVANCECDNTHQQNNTVCQWCWARGRRHFNDPPV
jgi:hypothetical protein